MHFVWYILQYIDHRQKKYAFERIQKSLIGVCKKATVIILFTNVNLLRFIAFTCNGCITVKRYITCQCQQLFI